jgi:Tfp pilus assembly protein PilX
MKKHNKIKNRGAASILLVMGLGILILLIVISVTSVETARLYLSQANVDGAQAYEHAQAGARDALMQISRNNNIGTTSIRYQVEMAEEGCGKLNACADVAISPLSTSTTGRIVGSIGYYKSARRGIEVIISFDLEDFGKIIINSSRETLTPIGF